MTLVDSFLRTATIKEICQDYILSGTDPFPYVIISDGCSSSKKSDVGARLLCYIARKYILTFSPEKLLKTINPDEIKSWIIVNAEFVYLHYLKMGFIVD